MRSPLNDTSKFYIFHKDIEHDMQDCRHLKKEIKDFLSRVYLGDLIGNDNRRMEHHPQGEVLI